MYHNGGIRYNIILNTEVIMLIHKIQNIIITLMIILLFASCNRNTAILEEMGMAENLMDSKPDSALTILENIPVTNIKGKEIAARYALLKSIALDKNYIDTTTFDVLQPAIDYYLKNCKLMIFIILIPLLIRRHV